MPTPEKQVQEKEGSEKLASIQEVLAKVENSNVLERLFARDEKVVNLVYSDDKELKPNYVPEPLSRLISEQEIIMDLINNPLTELERITERQDVIEALKDFELLDQLINFKNSSYLIEQGVSDLFSNFEVAPHQSFPALDAYRMACYCKLPGLEELVMDSIKEIENGKKGLSELIKTMEEIDQPIIKEITEVLKKDLESINHFGETYFLYEKYNSSETEYLSDVTNTDLKHCGVMAEYSNICVKDEYCKAGFNEDEPEGYIAGWNFSRLKKGREPQILNDSAEDKSLTVLTGTNRGGKSFNLVQNFYIQRLAQSFGFVPAQKANFEIYDSFFYLDRASTESNNDLSAYGAEVVHLGKVLEKMGNKVFLVSDECFSTTSDEDRYCLLKAVTNYLGKRQGKTLLSTHSEIFVKGCANDADVGVYNFPFTAEKNEKDELLIHYSHKLTKGPGDAGALEIADSMNLPKGLMESAKNYIEGVLEKAEPPKDRTYKEIVSYTNEERKAKKKETQYISLFGKEIESNKAFKLFSKDEDFEKGHSGWSRVHTGEFSCNCESEISMGGWRVDCVSKRKGLLLDLLTEGRKLTSQETVERQKMFEELSKNDRYEDFKEMGDKILWVIKFLPYLGRITGEQGFLDFNKVFLPKWNHMRPCKRDLDFCINFLRLNQKVLGKEFSKEYIKVLDKFKKGKKLLMALDEYKDRLLYQDIFDIKQARMDDYNEEISNKKIIAKYLKLTADEPNREKWEGKLTRLRIKEYMDWLKKKDFRTWYKKQEYGKNGHPLGNLINKLDEGYSAIAIVRGRENHFDPKLIKTRFKRIAYRYEPQEARDKWQKKICVQRIDEFINYLEHNHDYKVSDEIYDKKIRRLKGLKSDILDIQPGLNIKDVNIRKMIGSLFKVKDFMHRRFDDQVVLMLVDSLFSPLENIEKKIVGRSVYECDLKTIAPEIRFFAKHYKDAYKNHDCDYYHRWESDLILSLMLEMLVDKDYFKEFSKLLRSYDSVTLHRLANDFEKKMDEFFPFGEKERFYFRDDEKKSKLEEAEDFFERNDEMLQVLCTKDELTAIQEELNKGLTKKLDNLMARFSQSNKVKNCFNMSRLVYEKYSKQSLNEFYELAKYYKKIFLRHKLAEDWSEVKHIRIILDNPKAVNRDVMIEVVNGYERLTGKDIRDIFYMYYRSDPGDKKWNEEKENFLNFYQKEIIDSGFKDRLQSMLTDLDGAYEKAKAFVKKYRLSTKEDDENEEQDDFDKKMGNSVRNGNLWSIKKEILNRNSNADHSTRFTSIDEEQEKQITRYILEAQAMGLFGHMINTQGFYKVIYNTNGEVDFQKMFNIFEPKSIQQLNDAHFDKDNEVIRLVAAANMSGKTYHLKSLTMALLSALNTGYAPAEVATIPLFDNIMYLDRITTKAEKDMSSFSNEVEIWKKFFDIFDKKENTFTVANVDEAFSTTPDAYQTPFVYALIMEMMKRGQYLELASHNHKVFDILRKLEEDYLKAYTFDINIRPDGKVNFHHKMRELAKGEKTFSEAIAVARTIGGLPVEILDEAERIKNGRVNIDY